MPQPPPYYIYKTEKYCRINKNIISFFGNEKFVIFFSNSTNKFSLTTGGLDYLFLHV